MLGKRNHFGVRVVDRLGYARFDRVVHRFACPCNKQRRVPTDNFCSDSRYLGGRLA
jgi:hypothetical protein